MKKSIDAPIVPILLSLGGVFFIINAVASKSWSPLIGSLVLFLFAGLYLHTTLIGKFRILEKIVESLPIKQDAQVLDLGTGHGAFLVPFAKRLKRPGKIIGTDIWKQSDQSGNSIANTQKIVDDYGLSDVVELQTTDMRKLPFKNESFDFVIASYSIHNVKPKSARIETIAEAYRVLKVGGRLIIVDIEHVSDYREALRLLDVNNSEIFVRSSGMDGMFGLMRTKILTVVKS